MLTSEHIEFLKSSNITHVKMSEDGRYGIGVLELAYTFALVTGYDPTLRGQTNHHRFCYPKTKYTLRDIVEVAKQWDGMEQPPKGWVKYKGADSEMTPEQMQYIVKNRGYKLSRTPDMFFG